MHPKYLGDHTDIMCLPQTVMGGSGVAVCPTPTSGNQITQEGRADDSSKTFIGACHPLGEGDTEASRFQLEPPSARALLHARRVEREMRTSGEREIDVRDL